jgi:glutathione S-transferase
MNGLVSLILNNSDLHTSYSPLFNPATPELIRSERRKILFKYYALLERSLTSRQWLLGEQFSVADAYLFTVTNWARHVGLDLSRLPAITAFQQRVAGRPQVREAILAEGFTAGLIRYGLLRPLFATQGAWS